MNLPRFACASLLSWLVAGEAFAFSEPLLYPEPTTAGGGGGRFFTGSPLDGFSCAVCHEGAAPPTVEVKGFPTMFEPGESYDVELSWTNARKPHALNLEIVDTDGRAAGTITLPDQEDVDEDGRCSLSEDEAIREQVAASLVEQGSRKIISVLGCGAKSVKFRFEAPDERRIALTAAVVRSNQEEDTKGDGVLEIRRIARQRGEAGPPVEGCGAQAPAAPGMFATVLAALAGLLLIRRRPPR